MGATRRVCGNFDLVATSFVLFKKVSEKGFRLSVAVTKILGRKL